MSYKTSIHTVLREIGCDRYYVNPSEGDMGMALLLEVLVTFRGPDR